MIPQVRQAAKAAMQVILVVLVAMAPVVAAPPLADAADRPASVSVSYADLDIDRYEGAQTLYRRIVAAAGQVCRGASAVRSPNRRRSYDACRAQAVFQAVTEVSSPSGGAAVRVKVSRG